MDILYSPWREQYTKEIAHTKNEKTPKELCVFCMQETEDNDQEHFIFRRFKHHMVMLNLFPYNAGHILIVALEHKANLEDLSLASQTELIYLTSHCCTILKEALHADGINVGINMGKAGGAGIPSHFHMHVLPRFIGDTNFMPTLASTKVISFDLKQIYEQLKKHIDLITL